MPSRGLTTDVLVLREATVSLGSFKLHFPRGPVYLRDNWIELMG
ncbi:MAG: hypothetical protein ACI88U_000623, partial [Porticoccaceae bacterium]